SGEAHSHADHAHNHAHSHDAPAPHDDLGCAVTLFQLGVVTPLALPHVEGPRVTWTTVAHPTRDTLPLSSPSYLHRPVRGPPCIG
ncbi:MAG: hypothetical protein ABW223_09440, partial [Rariglobus sp.]